jgi:hypothetical protein
MRLLPLLLLLLFSAAPLFAQEKVEPMGPKVYAPKPWNPPKQDTRRSEQIILVIAVIGGVAVAVIAVGAFWKESMKLTGPKHRWE